MKEPIMVDEVVNCKNTEFGKGLHSSLLAVAKHLRCGVSLCLALSVHGHLRLSFAQLTRSDNSASLTIRLCCRCI